MENIVVDSSVVVKWLVVEPFSAEARRILSDYEMGALGLLVPDLIHAEVANVAWKKHLFQGVSVSDAQLIVDTFRGLKLPVTPSAALVEAAYRLAVTHRRSVYDMLYVALSLRETCRFVTADKKLVSAVGTALPNVVWLGHWPKS